jgi:DNA-binding NarL/FixJ family response regulator
MLKIILADNQAIFRAGAAKVLAVEDDFRIVAQCDTLDKFQGAVETFRGSIVIFSSAMKPEYATLLAQIKAAKSKAIVVAEMSDNVRQFLTNGILGVVYRNIGGPALVECVRKAARGEVWVQDAQILEEDSENDMVGARVRDRLTDKELKIVALIVQGYKNKEIANRLGTTEQVIKNYLRNVYDKIGVSDRLELALFTIHHRILAEAAAAITGNTNVPLPN